MKNFSLSVRSNSDIDTLNEQIINFLRGYGRGASPSALSELAIQIEWRAVALRELQKRSTRLIESFSDKELEAIAQGRVNLSELLKNVSEEMRVLKRLAKNPPT